jgi:hypothetical protein
MLPLLVTLNILLQLFDGVATYVGWERHGELNPLLRLGFEHLGVLTTLTTAKLTAILLILFIASLPRPTLATSGLAITLTIYAAGSFVPWSFLLLS